MRLKIWKKRALVLAMCFVTVFGVVGLQKLTVSAQELQTEEGYKYQVLEDGTVEITGYDGAESELVIPGTIDGKKVTVIGEKAFQNCEQITSVVIPYNVTTIKDNAFQYSGLEKITIPYGVKTIGDYAFHYCEKITSVVLPDSVTSIGEGCFKSCYKLENIILSQNLTYIGPWCFEDIRTLRSVIIPSSMTSIGEGAFGWCTGLENVVIPDSVTSIGNSAFNQTSIRSIDIPNSVTSIGEYAFCLCPLESIVIPDGVTSIASSAFLQCNKLKSITIPASVTYIGEDVFYKAKDNPTKVEETIYTYAGSYAEKWATENGYKVVILNSSIDVIYHTHIQTYGDSQGTKKNGEMAGTSGQAKRLENIWIKVEGNDNLGIQYTTHCQTYGWMPWSCDGEANGTSKESKRLEAIKIQLTGADKDKYDVYYRVHAQSYGWLGWAKNGEPSGTAGYAKRLEGIQVVVVKKGESAPGLKYAGVDGSSSKYGKQAYVAKTNEAIKIPGSTDAPNVMYKTHVQTYGWQKWMVNGQMSGTSGKSKRLEGINIKLSNAPYDGDIVYTTHVQKYGWKDGKPEADKATWKKNGEMSGTSGEAKRLEAICIALTGHMAEHYDVYYRVHAQTYGWLGWAKNGEPSGTAGYAKRLEGIQIVLVPKGGAAPADNYGGITSQQTRAYIEKNSNNTSTAQIPVEYQQLMNEFYDTLVSGKIMFSYNGGNAIDIGSSGVDYWSYAIKDINTDGVPELLIYKSGFLYLVYTLDQGEPVLITSNWHRGERYLLDDGTIYCYDNYGGVYIESWYIYKIKNDSSEITEYYFADRIYESDAPGTDYTPGFFYQPEPSKSDEDDLRDTNTAIEISEEKLREFSQSCMNRVVKIDTTSFKEYKR